MPTYDELRAAADEAWKAVAAPPRPLFVVSINTSSLASGVDETLAALRKLSDAGAGFDVMQTGDTGFAWAEPVVQVVKPGGQAVLYGHVSPDRAEAFAKAALGGIATDHAIGVVSGTAPGVPALDSLDWMKIQTRWIMHNCGVIDPEQIDHYIARGGYAPFLAATKLTPEELINVVKGSTLRGHSGSFFSTGTKWDFLRTATAEPKYLVCNADEGDPGAWVNRVVMESDPHMLLEGLLLAAHASGATYGWIYIRDEYPLAIARVTRAIEQCRERGIFGADALGTGVTFDAEVVRGAGSYVCGDETGLISSVNDERGMPRIKPPFPAQSGVLGKPTNVNNVETYACATTLMRLGGEQYSTVGTETNRGTKMFTVSGRVARTGCIEVPFGTKVRDLLAAVGGIAGGRPWKAMQQGGPLSGVLPAHIAADLPLEPEPFRPLGAGMGGGGIVFLDETSCIVDLNVMTSWFVEDESCARCTTCRIGNQRMLEILRRASRGEGAATDVDRMKSLAASMQNSNCFHGQLSPVMINNTLQFFREEYEAHALEHRCPAKVCAGLIRYRVASQHDGVEAAAAICPTSAIVRDGDAWSIDDGRCIRCDACRDVADGDIVIEDRYTDVIPLRVAAPADVARAGG
ncbi:MAG TPA: NADH-ubiquinone oxidoreductase-F iron-sulfur binding region domain-containing protein [Dehalococcoidia bacterium]|nr:NADH-ubiquinone oxidoreductase-F iron-sulfur binding region domain-containing protein [Dehalococcoidia bacterium]